MCNFARKDDRILKTVEAVHSRVESLEACRQLCLEAKFVCRSYDFGDTGRGICRLSHHSAVTLRGIQEPYLNAKVRKSNKHVRSKPVQTIY